MKVEYTNKEETLIKMTMETGEVMIVPVDDNNRHYRNLIENNIEIIPYVPCIIECKNRAENEISEFVENLRASVITAKPAKILVYERKSEVAKAALADQQWAKDLLQREADARGETPQELAQLIVNNENAYTYVAFQLDAIEEEAQASIKVADTEEEVEYGVNYAKSEFLKVMSVLSK